MNDIFDSTIAGGYCPGEIIEGSVLIERDPKVANQSRKSPANRFPVSSFMKRLGALTIAISAVFTGVEAGSTDKSSSDLFMRDAKVLSKAASEYQPPNATSVAASLDDLISTLGADFEEAPEQLQPNLSTVIDEFLAEFDDDNSSAKVTALDRLKGSDSGEEYSSLVKDLGRLNLSDEQSLLEEAASFGLRATAGNKLVIRMNDQRDSAETDDNDDLNGLFDGLFSEYV